MDKVVLHLDVNAVNTVLASLAKQPYEVVTGLIDDIRGQVIPQLPKKEVTDGNQ